jgi:hypothetical protein
MSRAPGCCKNSSICFEMRSATRGSANGASAASGSSVARGSIFTSRSARASAISTAWPVVQMPEAHMHERPEFSAIDTDITSRYCIQREAKSGPSSTLL